MSNILKVLSIVKAIIYPPSEANLYCNPSAASGLSISDSSSDDTIPVRVVSLDNYIAENQIKERLVMRIDVEGGELKVLQDAYKSLKKKQFEIVQFEALNEESFEKIRLFIESLQYDIYTVIDNKLKPVRSRVETKMITF
jgi:hypothetical protein